MWGQLIATGERDSIYALIRGATHYTHICYQQHLVSRNCRASELLGCHSPDRSCGGVVSRLLSITGRIKELIITAGGENIAPVPCEDSIKLHAGGVISNVVMIGDKRKFNTCLITLKQKPDPDANSGQGGFFEELDGSAAALSKTCTTAAQAAVDATWIQHLRAAISTYNTQVRCMCCY